MSDQTTPKKTGSETPGKVYIVGIAILATMLVSFLIVTQHSTRKPQEYSLAELPSDRPFVVIHRYPAYPLPGREIISGIIAAVWKDGRILRAQSESTIGKKYIEGRLSQPEL